MSMYDIDYLAFDSFSISMFHFEHVYVHALS